ncbi:MAG: adenylate kinase [Planctomycetota bacterium]
MRIAFIGPPGAGKGTQAERLSDRLGITSLSTGEVLREAQHSGTPAGREIAARLAAGQLVSDDLVLRIVADRLAEADCQHGYLFDGFPRTVAQAEELAGLLEDQGSSLDAAVLFEAAEEVLLERLASRGREDDTVEQIRQRLADYAQITRPVAAYYADRGMLLRIDAAGEPDVVYRRLIEGLKLED